MEMRVVLVAGVMALLVGACSSDSKQADNDADASQGAGQGQEIAQVNPSDYDLSGQPTTVAGLTFTPPKNWADLGASGMRQASYYLPAVEGETDSATVTVFYFGQGGGGTIDANIDRWIGQMATAENDNPAARASRDTIQVDGMPVHLVSTSGSYSGSMGGAMGGGSMLKENYEMVGAVVEGPEGNLFFKLTGPQKTATEMRGGFMAMVQSVKKAQ